MPRLVLFLLLSALLFPLRAEEAAADPNAAAMAQLRKVYRDTMLQLRDAQNQAVQLQAQLDQAKHDADELKTKLDSETQLFEGLVKKSADEKAASDKAISDLNDKLKEKAGQVASFQDAIVKWQDYQKQSERSVQILTQEGESLKAQVAQLQRLVQDREAKNFELFKTGNEILTRYQQFSFGDALAAKEPFIGITRAKLQGLVQDYADKLDHGAIKSAGGKVMQTPGPTRISEAPPSTVKR